VLIPDSAEAITEVPAQPVASPPPISKSDRPVPPLPIDPLQPLPSPRPMPKPPGQENGKTAPRVPALETLDPGVTKFGRIGSVPVPETSKGPKPPSVPSLPPNVPDAPKPIKQSNYEIPAPPKEVPNLPDDVPTPPVFDEIAPLPVIHETPAPLPFIHPEPTKK